MSDDELIDSILHPKEHRDKLKAEKDAAIKADKDVKPDYSQNGDMEPVEIKKVKFEYTPQDYSRGRDQMTEDEIIDEVLNPTHRKSAKQRDIADIHMNVSPEVKEQWLEKIGQSERKRGKAYKKLQE